LLQRYTSRYFCAEAEKGADATAETLVDCKAIAEASGSRASADAICTHSDDVVKVVARNGGSASGSDFQAPSCNKGKMPGGFAKVTSPEGNCKDPK
jgi:hypothetical protein